MVRFDLDMGAQVHCQDGDCGKLARVVIDPHTERVTDLVVERGFLLKTDRVLPIEAVEQVDEERIYLGIDSRELVEYPEYREVEFTVPASGTSSSERDQVQDRHCWQGRYRVYCPEPVVPLVRKVLHEGVPLESAIVERGTPVQNEQGTIGHVDHVLVDSESGEISHLVVRKGILPYYPVIPFSEVRSVGDKAITVGVTDEEMGSLPRYRSRAAEDIHAELQDRLDASSFDFSRVDLSVDSGVVRLAGWVVDRAARRRAEAAARSIDGVVEVENGLVTDESIISRVIEALSDDERTSVSIIGVDSRLGDVTLKGQVDSAEIAAAAKEIAADQKGVSSVRDELEVEPDADTERLKARWLAQRVLKE